MKSLREVLSDPPIIIGSRQIPTCGREDCNPRKCPEHWVDVWLTPVAQAGLNVLPELQQHLTMIRDTSDKASPADRPSDLLRIAHKINTLARVALVAIANIKQLDSELDSCCRRGRSAPSRSRTP